MNVAYDLEFDLDGFLSSLEKGRGARERVEEYQDSRRHKDEGAGYDGPLSPLHRVGRRYRPLIDTS